MFRVMHVIHKYFPPQNIYVGDPGVNALLGAITLSDTLTDPRSVDANQPASKRGKGSKTQSPPAAAASALPSASTATSSLPTPSAAPASAASSSSPQASDGSGKKPRVIIIWKKAPRHHYVKLDSDLHERGVDSRTWQESTELGQPFAAPAQAH